jgi:hypothetical protein
VSKLAALLRLAAGLDRGRSQVIEGFDCRLELAEASGWRWPDASDIPWGKVTATNN